MLAKADVFIQNLKPGAVGKLGFAIERLRRDYPKLICCSISGFGESGPYATRKSYDLLVQAESGLASVTGGPEAPARVGVSVTDIAAGMNAYEAVLEAIIARGRTGQGATLRVSLFDAMADWMTVPLLHHEGGQSPKRLGLAHPSIAPYGVFKSKDGADILISIQNDREWRILAADVMGDAALAADPKFAKLMEPREAAAPRPTARSRPRSPRWMSRRCPRSSKPPTSRSRASTMWRDSSSIRTCAASVSRPRTARCRIRRLRRSAIRRAATGAFRRWASIPRRCGGSSVSRYSIAGAASRTDTRPPRSEAVEPMKNTNGIDSAQITVSSMKSLA